MADHEQTADEHRVAKRADLLPEEQAAGGSDDPEAQAAAILEESDERTDSRDAAPGTTLEHRGSEDVTPPSD